MRPSGSETSGAKRVVAIAVVVVLVIGVVTGLIIYGDKVAPLQATVLEVDDSQVTMRYFLKRASQSVEAPQGVLQKLVTEEIVKQVAPESPFSIKITEEEIDGALREAARREILAVQARAEEESQGATGGDDEGVTGPEEVFEGDEAVEAQDAAVGDDAAAETPGEESGVVETAVGETEGGESRPDTLTGTISEGEFREWYERKLDQTGFSDDEYRDIVRRNLLQYYLTQYLAERVPTVAEQVKLLVISLPSLEEAEEVEDRLDDGEDFFDVAEELKAEDRLVDQTFDIGWRPRSAINPSFASIAFDQLEVGEYSDPFPAGERYYAIIKVADRAKARQVGEEVLQRLRSSAFGSWLQQELPYHRVVVHGLNNGWDQETEAWVKWQLQNY